MWFHARLAQEMLNGIYKAALFLILAGQAAGSGGSASWRPQIDQGSYLPTTLTQFLRVVKASIKQSSSSTSLLIYSNIFTIMELK